MIKIKTKNTLNHKNRRNKLNQIQNSVGRSKHKKIFLVDLQRLEMEREQRVDLLAKKH